MAGGRKTPGFTGRKFAGRRRLLDARTPGMPQKHEAWPGVQLDVTRSRIEHGSIKPKAVA